MKKILLTDCCELVMGQSPASSSYNTEKRGLPFYQGNADFGKINPITRCWCDKPIKIAYKDDILISVRAPIGAINIASEECCIGRGLAAVRALKGKCLYEFLYYALQSNTEELKRQGTGSTFKAISKQILANTELPDITLEEQHRIVNYLLKVDTLIENANEQLRLLDQLVKSRFIEMFGDPDENSKNWEIIILKKCLEVIGGYAFKSSLFKTNGIPVLRIGNINTGVFKPINLVYWEDDLLLSRYKIYPGDLVMSLTGTVGKDDYGNVCILGKDYPEYYLNQRNAKLELGESINKIYLSELLKWPQIKNRLTGISRGVRQANISNKDILELNVPLPPLDLQNQFADFVEQVNKSKLEVQKSLEELETLKKSLMQQYFG